MASEGTLYWNSCHTLFFDNAAYTEQLRDSRNLLLPTSYLLLPTFYLLSPLSLFWKNTNFSAYFPENDSINSPPAKGRKKTRCEGSSGLPSRLEKKRQGTEQLQPRGQPKLFPRRPSWQFHGTVILCQECVMFSTKWSFYCLKNA